MASPVVNNDVSLKLPKTFKEVSKLTKPKRKEICKKLSIDFEKSIGKKALINILCNALNISTSGSSDNDKKHSSTSTINIPTVTYLQKLKEWQKNLNGVPLLMEECLQKTESLPLPV